MRGVRKLNCIDLPSTALLFMPKIKLYSIKIWVKIEIKISFDRINPKNCHKSFKFVFPVKVYITKIKRFYYILICAK